MLDFYVIKLICLFVYYVFFFGNFFLGGLLGIYKEEGRGVDKEEVVKGMSKFDGSVFLRVVGVIMMMMVFGGEGVWDRS